MKNPLDQLSPRPKGVELQQLLIDAAEKEILPRYQHAVVRNKPDGTLVTDADIEVQRSLREGLYEHWPEIPLLGEEMTEEQQRQVMETACFWCLDPLDGTTNFSIGLPYFAISLALIIDHRPVLGLVYDPIRKESFRAEKGGGAWLNDRRLTLDGSTEDLKDGVAVIDLKRLTPPLIARLAKQPPYRSQRSFGAVALEWSWMAAGRGHLYLHGGQRPWDYAAGCLIFSEAGGTLGDGLISGGRPMSLQSQAAIGASNPRLYNQWLKWLEEAGYES
ncbi:MAG: inositol monophosphatase family protein [Candidatus Sedimenticola sp. (ex Thyasira tokunagai)]